MNNSMILKAAVLAVAISLSAEPGEARAATGFDLHTTLGTAFVMSRVAAAQAGCPSTDPWTCVWRDSDGDGIPDIQDACPNQPGSGDGCPDDGNNFGCAAGWVLQTYGFYSGAIGLIAPEPAVSKAYSAIGYLTGGVGTALKAAFCG